MDSDEPPSKRRRLDPHSPGRSDTPVLQRSPSTAVALLVLALGAAVLDGKSQSREVDIVTGIQSEAQGVTRAVPGLQRYSEAVQAMAGHVDGSSLSHAQMFILAGLYKARLARVREASTWYSMAGRVLLHLIQRRQLLDEDRRARPAQEHRNPQDDLILRCAWSCLQLESEILPDLRLPRSGLEQVGHCLLLPSSIAELGSSNSDKISREGGRRERCVYTAQLHLRHLSDGFDMALSFTSSTEAPRDIQSLFSEHATALQQWRSSLPPSLQWEDSDLRPRDITTASLRHAYWRAKSILTRPFLDFVLHNDRNANPNDGHEDYRAESRNPLTNAIRTMRDATGRDEIPKLAGLCIEATKQSLTAYDSAPGPLIVDNIQTLAHNRFEDVLLLAAAHRNEKLRKLLSKSDLQLLMSNTTDFLQQHSAESLICAADHRILPGLQQANFDMDERFRFERR